MARPVVYFELMGGDGEVLRDFYAQLFGWETTDVEETGGGYQRIAGAGLEGGLGTFPGAPSYVTFYVQSDDLEADVARVGQLGGRTVMEPRTVTGSIRTALVEDPAGHVIGLIAGL